MGSPSCSYGMELYLDHGSHFEEVMNADDDDGGDWRQKPYISSIKRLNDNTTGWIELKFGVYITYDLYSVLTLMNDDHDDDDE